MKRLHSKSRPNGTWQWSDDMLLKAVDAIVAGADVVTRFDIPYVAGSDESGSVYFIDKRVPKTAMGMELWVPLTIHETVEKSLRTQLKLEYLLAHQIALRIERQVVEAKGWDWEKYDKIMQHLIREDEHEQIKHCPYNLDLGPYRDEKDFALIEAIEKAMPEIVNY